MPSTTRSPASGREGALSFVLGQLAWLAHPRTAARAHHRGDPRGEGADFLLRGPPMCGTSTNVVERRAAAGQDADAGRCQSCHEPGRTPRTRRRPHPALSRARRPRERHCRHRLRRLGGRVHADLAGAKLRTLVKGRAARQSPLWP